MSKDNMIHVRVDDPTMRKVLEIASYLDRNGFPGKEITTSDVIRYSLEIAALNIRQERTK